MLTKAKLAEYIERGNRLAVGTRLITVELGECKVVKSTAFGYRCEGNKTSLNYTQDLKIFDWHSHTSLIDPEVVANPFTMEELELIITETDFGPKDTQSIRESIHTKANHLLTTPSEFPQMMEVWETTHDNKMVAKVLGMFKGRYIVDIGWTWTVCKHARPIPKVKTLADLKANDEFWDKDTFEKLIFLENVGELVKYANSNHKECCILNKHFYLHFQLTIPTSQQITAAKQAAIEEVKRRFEALEKEVNNGNN